MKLTFLLVATLLLPSMLFAEDAQKVDEKWVSLFDGKTLDGWRVEKCQAEVQDGCIFLKGGNGWVRHEKSYGDFVLELEWKAVKKDKYDSGVFIRAVPAGKAPWPGRNQINLRQDLLGNIQQYKGAVASYGPRQAGRLEPLPNSRRRQDRRVTDQRQAGMEDQRSHTSHGSDRPSM